MKKRKYLLTSALLFSTLGLAMTSVSCDNTRVVEKAHKVNCETSNDYSIATDVAEAKKGDTVIITVSVTNTEKVLDKVLVNNSEEGVEVISKGSKYSFVMGEEDVTISATLTDKVYENKTLSVNTVNGFNVTFKVGENSVTEAKKGDTVNVFIENTTDDRRFKSLTSSDVTLNTVKEGEEYSFLMIDNNVTLALEDEAIPTHNLAFTGTNGMSAKFFYKGEEVTSGIEGKEITVKVTLEDKYAFDSLTSTTEGVNLTATKEGEEYTFIMPKTDVAINGECHKVVTKYAVTKVLSVGKVSEITGVSKDSKFDEASEVSFSFKYSDKKYSYGAYINNELVMATLDETTTTGTIKFNMPSSDVEIIVGPFEENDPETEGANIVTVELPEVSSDYKIFGIKSGKYDLGGAYNYRTINVYVVTNTGVLVSTSGVTYSIGGGRDTTMSYDTSKDYYTFAIYNAKAGDVIQVKVNSSKAGTKKVNITNADNVEITGEYADCTVGSKVKLGVTPKTGYTLVNSYYPNYVVKNYSLADGNTTGVKFDWDTYNNVLSFTMPAQDLTFTFNLGVVASLTYEPNDKIESVKFFKNSYSSETITEATSGTDVYVEVKAKDGYRLKHVFVNDKNLEATLYSGSKYKFTIPSEAKEVKIICEFDVLYSLTYEQAPQGYTLSGLNDTYFASGEEVTFDIYRKVGYKIDSVTLSDGTVVTKATDSASKYSFIMPNTNVTLNVNVSEVVASTLTFDNSSKAIKTFTITDMYNNKVNSGDKVNSDETLNILITPSNGFSVENLQTTKGTITKVDNTHYSLVNPSEDFTITPTYNEEEKFDITIVNEHTEWYEVTSFKDNYETDISSTKKGYVGHTINLQISSIDNSKGTRYFTKAIVTNLTTNKEIETKSNDAGDNSLYVSFEMPNAAVSIKFDIVEKVTRNLLKTGENANKFKIYDSSSSYSANEISTGFANDTIYVRLVDCKLDYLNSNEDFTLSYTYNLDGVEKTESYKFGYYSDYARITLPDADVTFSLTYTTLTELNSVKVTQNEYSSKLIVSDTSSTYSAVDFGDDFSIKSGVQLYVIADINSSDLSNGTFTIQITNSDTGEEIKSYKVTSTYSKYTYFNISTNVTITLLFNAK